MKQRNKHQRKPLYCNDMKATTESKIRDRFMQPTFTRRKLHSLGQEARKQCNYQQNPKYPELIQSRRKFDQRVDQGAYKSIRGNATKARNLLPHEIAAQQERKRVMGVKQIEKQHHKILYSIHSKFWDPDGLWQSTVTISTFLLFVLAAIWCLTQDEWLLGLFATGIGIGVTPWLASAVSRRRRLTMSGLQPNVFYMLTSAIENDVRNRRGKALVSCLGDVGRQIAVSRAIGNAETRWRFWIESAVEHQSSINRSCEYLQGMPKDCHFTSTQLSRRCLKVAQQQYMLQQNSGSVTRIKPVGVPSIPKQRCEVCKSASA